MVSKKAKRNIIVGTIAAIGAGIGTLLFLKKKKTTKAKPVTRSSKATGAQKSKTSREKAKPMKTVKKAPIKKKTVKTRSSKATGAQKSKTSREKATPKKAVKKTKTRSRKSTGAQKSKTSRKKATTKKKK